jgi:HEAT repeat protein
MKTHVLMFALTAALGSAQTPLDRAWTTLTTGANDKGEDRRSHAIQALGLTHGDAKAAGMAEQALADSSEDVRVAAATALGQMDAKSSAPKLKAAVKDPQAAVVFAAANALFVLGDPDAFEVYYAVLAGEKKSGDSLMASQMKMIKDPKSLAKIGFESGVGFIPYGGVGLKTFKTITKDDESPVRAAAAAKLAKDPDPRTEKLLETSLKDKKWLVRAAAVDALAKRGDPAVIPVLATALDDDNEIVQFTAAAAIIRLNSPESR